MFFNKRSHGKEYTMDYVRSFEECSYPHNVGDMYTWHDISGKKWRLMIRLAEEYWYLSVFFHEDGRFDMFCLDEERADDSHYEFRNEKAVRRKLYQKGAEDKYFHEIVLRYVKEHGGDSFRSLIGFYITAEFHYY